MWIGQPLFTGSFDSRSVLIVSKNDNHSKRVAHVIMTELMNPTVEPPIDTDKHRQPFLFLPMDNVTHVVDADLRVIDSNNGVVELYHGGRMIVRNEWSLNNDPKHDPYRGQAMVRSLRAVMYEVIACHAIPTLIKASGLDPDIVRTKNAIAKWASKRTDLKGPDGRTLPLKEIKKIIEAEQLAEREKVKASMEIILDGIDHIPSELDDEISEEDV